MRAEADGFCFLGFVAALEPPVGDGYARRVLLRWGGVWLAGASAASWTSFQVAGLGEDES